MRGNSATLKVDDYILTANTWTKILDDNVQRTQLTVFNNTSTDNVDIGLGNNTTPPTTFFKITGAATGTVVGDSHIYKFGINEDVNETLETVWEGGGLYSYPSSAVAMTVTSAGGATDNGVKVLVQGLDANYDEQTEEVTLAGAGTATTIATFLRVFRAYISNDQVPTGSITIANGGTTYAYINGDHQTLMAVWTVPRGYTAYLKQTDITVHTEQNNKYGTVSIVAKEPNGVFRTQDSFTAESETVTRTYSTPVTFPEKTDIEVRGIASSSNAALHISAILEITYASDATVGINNTDGFTFPVAPINAVWVRSQKPDHKIQVLYDD
jgi:hypothetical protein